MASARFAKALLGGAILGIGVSANEAGDPQAPANISCIAEAGKCSESDKRANESVAPGVNRRKDAEVCCCPVVAPFIWSDPSAKCQEAHKCMWKCCGTPYKLCGEFCCDRAEKCINGRCETPSPSPTPAPSPHVAPASWIPRLLLLVPLCGGAVAALLWNRCVLQAAHRFCCGFRQARRMQEHYNRQQEENRQPLEHQQRRQQDDTNLL
mmetsp:Transcript_91162/g.262973  ORF Transcript_91162/g.262973 Transcript_91162/m.262973 type:complete len:209 (-) Transcript_91162:170-796(-)